ncbi:MAG: hypothetical protein M3541_05620 [Acidobacteriota bacterium]|nr:hypothetical protein [Acidobacteriota bacterium]MDQ3418249.1 hypothetical protein [Acidobacteriota bacterium]
MTEQLKVRPIVDGLDDVPDPLRMFYEKGADEKFHLQLDGEPAGFTKASDLQEAQAKLAEFRENNRSLNQRLKTFDGIDPAEYAALKAKPATDPKVTELETAAAAEKARAAAAEEELATARGALADERLRNAVNYEFSKSNGRPDARQFMEQRARDAGFTVGPDGQITNDKTFSQSEPGAKLTLAEFMAGELVTSKFAFQSSLGGGAHHAGGAPARRVISRHDPLAVGAELEAIAAGKVEVR